MSELDNLLGSSISLITQLDVRYDGVLFSINAKEASIVLREVKCLGTEDRVADAAKKVAASDKVIPFVTFPGNDIKDLFVHEQASEPAASAPAAPVAAAASSLPQPPAVPTVAAAAGPAPVAAVEPPKPPLEHNRAPVGGDKPYRAREPRNEYRKPQDQQQQQQPRNDRAPYQPRGDRPQQQQQPRFNNYQSNTTAGTGEHLLNSREQKPIGGREADSQSVKSEFDFSAGLKTFDKEAVLAEVASKSTVPVDAIKYSKDDFFDSFSTDQNEDGRAGRLTFAEERKLNQDTFGISSLRSGGSNYRGGGGGGRGRNSNYGTGRGRGRSSYNRNSYYDNNKKPSDASASAAAVAK